jgi:hypothetical protein
MKPLRAAFLSLALLTTSLGATYPAMADTPAVDPSQVSTLVTDIENAINALPPGSSVAAIEAAVNGAIAKDGFSKAVVAAALQVVQTAEASGSNASLAVASLASAVAGGSVPGSGGVGGGSPIGGLSSGSSGGSGYVGP